MKELTRRQFNGLAFSTLVGILAGCKPSSVQAPVDNSLEGRLISAKTNRSDEAGLKPWNLNPVYQAIVREMVSENLSVREKAKLLYDVGMSVVYHRDENFVYGRPEGALTANDVIRKRYGTCLELTNFYLGLAEVAGIRTSGVHVKPKESVAKGNLIMHHVFACVEPDSSSIIVDLMMKSFDDRSKMPIIDFSTMRVLSSAELESEYYLTSAACYVHAGKKEDALVSALKSVELTPANFVSHVNLGFVFSELGRNEEAFKAYSRAAEIENTSFIHYNLGNSLLRLKRYDESFKEYLRSIELDNTDAKPWIGLAKLYELHNDSDNARKMYAEAARRGSEAAANKLRGR